MFSFCTEGPKDEICALTKTHLLIFRIIACKCNFVDQLPLGYPASWLAWGE